MDAVAIGANGGLLRAVGDGAAMDAGLIGEEGLRGFAVRLHEELLAVAATAGSGNVGVAHGRFGIVAGDDRVDIAVAILATCGDFAGDGDLGVNAMRVGFVRVGVALVAGDFFRGRIVRDAFDVGVAIDAGEHGAVNGVLGFVLVDGDAVAVARGHGGVGVAGEAVGVLELLRGSRGRGPKKKREDEQWNREPTSNVHKLRRCLGEVFRRDRSHKGSF